MKVKYQAERCDDSTHRGRVAGLFIKEGEGTEHFPLLYFSEGDFKTSQPHIISDMRLEP